VLISNEHQPWIHPGCEKLPGYVCKQYEPSQNIHSCNIHYHLLQISQIEVGKFEDDHQELLLDSIQLFGYNIKIKLADDLNKIIVFRVIWALQNPSAIIVKD
jgi:hypothetical protein